jgi:hypothetical protein
VGHKESIICGAGYMSLPITDEITEAAADPRRHTSQQRYDWKSRARDLDDALRRGIRPNLISPKSKGVPHIVSDDSPAPLAYAAMWSPGDSENPIGTADLVYLAADWVDCCADD